MSTDSISQPIADILRLCYVAFIRDFLHTIPEGIPKEDVFVCETRYNSKAKSMDKIKVWGKKLKEGDGVVGVKNGRHERLKATARFAQGRACEAAG